MLTQEERQAKKDRVKEIASEVMTLKKRLREERDRAEVIIDGLHKELKKLNRELHNDVMERLEKGE